MYRDGDVIVVDDSLVFAHYLYLHVHVHVHVRLFVPRRVLGRHDICKIDLYLAEAVLLLSSTSIEQQRYRYVQLSDEY